MGISMGGSMSNQIDLKKAGITLSYRRFLSDSASGYVLLLVLLICYYNRANLDWITPIIPDYQGFKASSEVKTLVAVLIFLLATPLGLIINALSWFFLDSIGVSTTKWFFFKARAKKIKFINSVCKAYLFEKTTDFFKVNEENFDSVSLALRHTLNVYHPQLCTKLDIIQGAHILLRNFSFMCFFAPISLILISESYFIKEGLSFWFFSSYPSFCWYFTLISLIISISLVFLSVRYSLIIYIFVIVVFCYNSKLMIYMSLAAVLLICCEAVLAGYLNTFVLFRSYQIINRENSQINSDILINCNKLLSASEYFKDTNHFNHLIYQDLHTPDLLPIIYRYTNQFSGRKEPSR